MSNAAVDPSYTCPVGAHNAAYDIHGTIDAHNGTSKEVTITAVQATLTLAAVKGEWLQKVGEKYVAANATYSPTSVAAGARTTLTVTIPSACTGRVKGAPVASGDYAVSFDLTTSVGTFKTASKNRHQITTG
ncbi:MAG: hypothetical protein E6I73_05720 [Chloroflexi bacterium]|nr:MAG: hypothetical protein E6I73_05720 [Chloroflexota bacterium]